MARIKGRRADNAVGLDGCQQRCAWQPEVQSKVNVLGGPTEAEAIIKSRETDRENGYENRSLFLATSDPLKLYSILLSTYCIFLMHTSFSFLI